MTRTPTVAQPSSLAPVVPGMLPAGSYTLSELEHLATVCHKSGLFDDVTDAAQAFLKILRGQELGLPVTTSMMAFDIVRKRIFLKPWVIAAKINASGYGSFRVVHQSSERCTIRFRRKEPGTGWYECPDVTYTIQEAEAHGLTSRSPHWKSSPGHMLFQRAMGRGGMMYFAELFSGLTPPQDDTPITPGQHAQNMYDVYGVEPETVAPALPAPGQEDMPDSDQPGKRWGASITAAIGALHLARGKDQAWLAAWWARVCRERGVQSPDALALSTLAELHQHIRRYYDNQAGQALPEPDAEPAQGGK